MILETTFLIDLLRNNKDAKDKLNDLINSGTSIKITSPSLFEIYSGIERKNYNKNEKDKVRQILSDQIILTLDEESAIISGEIDGQLISQGKTIDTEDCMIAGIAIKNNEKILTRNIKHFTRIKNLDFETY